MTAEGDKIVWTVGALHHYFEALLHDINVRVDARVNHLEEKLLLMAAERNAIKVANDAAVHREIAAAKEVITTRMDESEKASVRLDEHVNRVPTLLDRESARLSALMHEKFAAIQNRFEEVDLRMKLTDSANHAAVSAAFLAQKEAAWAQNAANAAAIAKSEIATTKQLDNILALLASNSSGMSDRLVAINDRIGRTEKLDSMVTGRTEGIRQNNSQMLAIVMAGLALLGLGVNYLATQQNSLRLGSVYSAQSTPPAVHSP